jgi:hypothetical protein
MAGSTSSKPSPRSERTGRRAVVRGLSGGIGAVALCAVASLVIMAAAVAWYYRAGETLFYGDAEAHLDIARRLLDARHPGWHEIGTTWLPLPHLLMAPFVRYDWLWQSGLGGAIPAAVCMALAATFLFAAVRRIYGSTPAALAAWAILLLNPNSLYMGAIPMTEPMFFAALCALLFFTVRYRAVAGWGALLGASLAAFAGTLIRYEGWFLIPSVTLAIWIWSDKKIAPPLVFSLVAGAGPALWLLHNRYYYSDALYFYHGPYSAIAIQGQATYPGQDNWVLAAQYFLAAGQLVAKWPALILGAAGALLALSKRIVWPFVLLTLPLVFYVWSIHSASLPLYMPTLWPHTFYNTRYAVAFLPLLAVGAGALARFGKPAALAVALISFAPFLIHPTERPITWQESDVNSRARRQWIAEAVSYLRISSAPGDTFLTSFGRVTPIYRILGFPLRNTLVIDDDEDWNTAAARPDLFLHTNRALFQTGDDAPTQAIVDKTFLRGPRFELEKRIMVKGAPALEIYRRIYENPLP